MASGVSSGPSCYIGVMSGTSLDGVDAVLVDFADGKPRLLGHVHRAYAEELKSRLLALCEPGADEIERAAIASQHAGRSYVAAIEDLLLHTGFEAEQVRALGVHGQTVRHKPEAGYSIQLNAPALIAELTGIDVIVDFRSRDLAAGGQGAPLVPAFHAAVFSDAMPRAVVNIGGISNLTGLPAAGDSSAVVGFDCGPGNMLLDAWAQRHLALPFDEGGAWAAQGTVQPQLLALMTADPYFDLPPPKSTGREAFGVAWLDHLLRGYSYAPVDVQATLTRLSAVAIQIAIEQFFPSANEVLVCGGGAFNRTLMSELAELCAPRAVLSSLAAGIAPEHVEALAFAWLAYAHVERLPGSLPAVTGARGARVLGALHPAG